MAQHDSEYLAFMKAREESITRFRYLAICPGLSGIVNKISALYAMQTEEEVAISAGPIIEAIIEIGEIGTPEKAMLIRCLHSAVAVEQHRIRLEAQLNIVSFAEMGDQTFLH